jgi:hypothetical protein
MATFAQGTPQKVVDDYYRSVGPSLGGTGPERPQQRQSFAAPGRARPMQPASLGTAYAPQAQRPLPAPPAQQPAQRPLAQAAPQPAMPPAMQPFQAQTLNFDGTQSQMPNFQQRDAFISQINNQLGQMQQQSWQQPMGAPQFNFPQMWGQAGQMVDQGWQNPFRFPTG